MSNSRSVALTYIRKSDVKSGTTDPASPELQAHAAAERAASLGLVVEQYVDAEGHRSGKTGKRPGWQAVTRRLSDPDVGALIVYSHDRAWRNLKELLNTADECVRLGVKFILVKDGIDVSTAQGRFLLSLLGSFAEFESNIGSERRAATIDWLRRQHGQHMGRLPFGLERRRVDGHLTLFPSTHHQPNGTDYDALSRLYELYAGGRLGYSGVMDQLNAEGWQVRGVGRKLMPFQPYHVRAILHNHWVYSGWLTLGREGRKATGFELEQGNHGALLPAEWLASVAARLSGHTRGWRNPRNVNFPLTGLATCACGQPLTGLDKDPRRYYRHNYPCPAGHAYCYAAGPVESATRDRLRGLRLPDDAEARYPLPGPGEPRHNERDKWQMRLERAGELYLEGTLTRARYEAERAECVSQLATIEAGSRDDSAGSAFLVSLTDIDEATPAEFRHLARGLYARIVVSGATQAPCLSFEPHEWCAAWA